MKNSSKKSVPLYSIDQFQKKSDQKKQYEIEVFHKNRDFKVSYPHRHDFYEILFLTEGSGTHTIDLDEHIIKPNTIFFLSPGQIHDLVLSQDIKGFIFLFTAEFYLINKQDQNKLLELPFFYHISGNSLPLYLKKEEAANFIDLFEQAIEENKNNQDDSSEIIRSLLDILLVKCKRCYPIDVDEKSKKSNLLVKRFKQLIEEKYQENLSVKEYAELLSVTANHLSETVKNLTGRTPTDLINDKMILEIKRLLIHTELTVSEIAFQLHFVDQSYFSRYFKKQTGISPGDFRIQSIKST